MKIAKTMFKFKEFILSIALFLLGVGAIMYARSFDSGWAAIGYAIIGILLFFMTILSLVFVFLNKILKIKMNWWKYAILIVVLFGISYGVMFILVRL